MTDLLGGQIQVTFTDMASSIAYIRAGKLRALAVTTVTRSEPLPEVPTLSDFDPRYGREGGSARRQMQKSTAWKFHNSLPTNEGNSRIIPP